MFDLATALAWGLQGVGAVGAIWGLFSSDTSAKNKRTGKRRLTERGWFAVGGVVLGLCGFALNQSTEQDRRQAAKSQSALASLRSEQTLDGIKKSRDLLINQKTQAESEAEKQRARADQIQNQLLVVNELQGRLNRSQGGLLASQQSQIGYLSNLAMVQQTISTIELSWLSSERMNQNLEQRVSSDINKYKINLTGNNVFLDKCLLFGDLTISRRPNNAWDLYCVIPTGLGFKGYRLELSPGDPRALWVEGLLDVVLSPTLIIENSKGDLVATSNVATRPESISRTRGYYKFTLDLPHTRFSSLKDHALRIRMPEATRESDLQGLPKSMRLRSLDPLARFDIQWRPVWELKTISKDFAPREPGGDLEEFDVKAAVANVEGFKVSFDRLLSPSGAAKH